MNLKLAVLVIAMFASCRIAFPQQPNSSVWMYPEGNINATRHNPVQSLPQPVDSFIVKWSTPLISGDVRPLIGNLSNQDSTLLDFDYEANEIAALMGDEIILISGSGKLITRSRLPFDYVNGINAISGISALIDTLDTDPTGLVNGNLVMALETIEVQDPENTDSIAYAYIFGYREELDSVVPLKRFAINLKQYKPNNFASISPVFGYNVNGDLMMYATVNMTSPTVPGPNPQSPPFYRGLAQFYDTSNVSSFPLPDIRETLGNSVNVGQEVNRGTPSVFLDVTGALGILLPAYPSLPDSAKNFRNLVIESVHDPTYSTNADIASILGVNVLGTFVSAQFPPSDIVPADGNRPFVRPYYLDITDGWTGQAGFILAAEEYNGIDSSSGVSKLHLHDLQGFPLTNYSPTAPVDKYFEGGENHFWSVAVGDVDGIPDNEWLPHYPNYQGKELIVTQSSRDFVYPGSRLFIFRYYTGPSVEKPTPGGDFLYTFDTVATQKINGWVAAVNDLDGADDGKDEIILVDGSKLRIVRMRDYSDERFRLGRIFDTVFTHEFYNQTISNVAVADLEGDELNDIIVTTHDSTFILGNVIANTLSIYHPTEISNYCIGDTVEISWFNEIISSSRVRVNFIEYDSSGVLVGGDTVEIYSSFPNDADSVTCIFQAPDTLKGKSGKIVIESESSPGILNDTTFLMIFNGQNISQNNYPDTVYTYDYAIFEGEAFCADSVRLEYLALDSSWVSLDTAGVDENNEFLLSGFIPCLTGAFDCSGNDSINRMDFRIVSINNSFESFSDTVTTVYLPARIRIEIDSHDVADPTQYFTWNVMDFDTTIACDTISVSFSIDGDEFFEIGNFTLEDEKGQWEVPVNIPDTVTLRFCCNSSCLRLDTLISHVTPRYIDIVAPNPFRPPQEELMIVYEVPEETTVTITILDQRNRIVATPAKELTRIPGIAYSANWDGRRPDGSLAHNGLYYVRLELGNGVTEIYPAYLYK